MCLPTRRALVVIAALSAGAVQAEDVSVRVERGQTLSDLAQTYYGDGTFWQRICDANRSQIANCNSISTGQTLVIPGEAVAETGTVAEPYFSPPETVVVIAPAPQAAPPAVPQPVDLPETLARHGGTPQVDEGWFAGADENGLSIIRIATGVTADGLRYADYQVRGVASSNFVVGFYRTQMSLTSAGRGDAFRARVLFQQVDGDADSIGGLAVFVVENAAGGFFGFEATADAKTAQTLTEFEATRILDSPEADGVRVAIVLRGLTPGMAVDYSFRVANLRLEQVQ
jgi:hypothetical protein